MIQKSIPQNFIGLDVDSISFDWYLKTPGNRKGKWGRNLTTRKGLSEFIKWIKSLNSSVVALEGFHGQNLVIEQSLRQAGIPFYSIPPFNIARYRESNISINKNNINDAKAVASFSLNQYIQGDLDKFKNAYTPNYEIRTLTRRYHQLSKMITIEYSNLWKYLKIASSDLYIALKGKHPDHSFNENSIKTKGILTLLMEQPDLNAWKTLNENQMIDIMGGKCYVNRKKLIASLKNMADLFQPVPESLAIPISQIAGNIKKYLNDKKQIERALLKISEKQQELSVLLKEKGIGIITASMIVAEIIDIRRFANDDKLASYTGFGRVEDKTGDKKNMKHSMKYNRYLKDAFMTAALHHLRRNKDSKYTQYYKQKISEGHSKFYARKMLARALLRRIYKILKEVHRTD